jgi:short-subunit dehydrogenase
MERRGAVVIGASAGVGRAVAETLARARYDLVLAARDRRDLSALASDLETRAGVKAVPLPLDLLADDDALSGWFDICWATLPEIDAVIITAGSTDDSDDGTSRWGTTEAIVTTNFLAVVKLCGRVLEEFERRNRGTLVLFSSIAVAAPRRRNVAYTAAKSGLESYARSMQHRFADTDVHVQVYALGYVDTAMTRSRRLLLPVARPSTVAKSVVGGLGRSVRHSYLPRFWRVVTFALKRTPWPVYRRLEF